MSAFLGVNPVVNNEKNSLPLVSIIIDNYNYGRFIQDAIESALNQTYPNIEVIVVDDGSTDNSREIISRYASAGLVKAVLKENGGQASAMNAGFEVSSGDLVVFLDSDDVLKPEAIEVAVKTWHPGVSKVQWRLEAIDGQGSSIELFFPPLNAHLLNGNVQHIAKRWFYFGLSPQSGNLYPRDFLEIAMPLPEEEWRICADYPLIAAAVFYGEIISLPDVLGLYRLHGGNAVGKKSAKISVVLEQNDKVRRYLHERFCRFAKGIVSSGLDEKRLKLVNAILSKENGIPYVSRVRTGFCGALDSLVYPFFTSFSKRVLSFIWFLLVGVLPSSLAKFVAVQGIPDGNTVG
ncbi:hypothetical protein COPRO5265_0433 [Coprothermobacter proteolyticus DSM 5265]|uniref:Putative glycosyltransferase protein n=1 Tax=Coprothermobacter proteolyticus (strain ATCC 35245 / DSM 5265 / OCM 4 / BT) TaxID=309798 RepID=B5Y7Q1_COPPD|nr:glycosyltransferase [Coprothermobacter proteolyticus]ACI18105.1 hypothetical protein COPRO5265_0433 [Coprothermobacter proteolyticus DSM 5265]